ncbi:MAG: nucleotidyl transferase AbiEii/AbiGii toxin family protein [Methanosarcinaceae archaeon]|nr:nucleotidyl transferase AbiEii/AbiGii toxin family protein [Methanosarcinaceae archaeon]
MTKSIFEKQATLLLQLLPLVEKHKHFALKGGTALNFFIHALPRFSVDIDLVFIPILNRENSLEIISDSLYKISIEAERRFSGVRITRKVLTDSQECYALIINHNGVIVKIEPNLVIRGSVFGTQRKGLHPDVQNKYNKFIEMSLLSFPDLYGGKICAALDRQHPRDLFDIKVLLESKGIEEKTRKAFIVYLISHSRPIAELLAPHLIDIKNLFENEFRGMTTVPVSLDSLTSLQKDLAPLIVKSLSADEKRFILSIKAGMPDWELLGIGGIEKLPAVQWKLQNIAKMTEKKQKIGYDKLKATLQI